MVRWSAWRAAWRPTAKDWASRRSDGTFAPSCVHGVSYLLLALLLAACASQPAAPTPEPSFPSRNPEREALGPAVADLAAKAEALLRSQDELVWKHWTEGIPADLATTYVGKEGCSAGVRRPGGAAAGADHRRA